MNLTIRILIGMLAGLTVGMLVQLSGGCPGQLRPDVFRRRPARRRRPDLHRQPEAHGRAAGIGFPGVWRGEPRRPRQHGPGGRQDHWPLPADHRRCHQHRPHAGAGDRAGGEAPRMPTTLPSDFTPKATQPPSRTRWSTSSRRNPVAAMAEGQHAAGDRLCAAARRRPVQIR